MLHKELFFELFNRSSKKSKSVFLLKIWWFESGHVKFCHCILNLQHFYLHCFIFFIYFLHEWTKRICLIFFFFLGCSDHKVNLPSNIETIASDYITKKSDFGCSEDFEELALRLMLQHNLLFPKDETECRQLYDRLLYEIANI